MITPERVYEVFGIKGDPLNEGINRRFVDLVEASPEMLVVLVNIVYENDLAFENNTLGRKLFNGANKQAIKAIESSDSQGRSWEELKKELEE